MVGLLERLYLRIDLALSSYICGDLRRSPTAGLEYLRGTLVLYLAPLGIPIPVRVALVFSPVAGAISTYSYTVLGLNLWIGLHSP